MGGMQSIAYPVCVPFGGNAARTLRGACEPAANGRDQLPPSGGRACPGGMRDPTATCAPGLKAPSIVQRDRKCPVHYLVAEGDFDGEGRPPARVLGDVKAANTLRLHRDAHCACGRLPPQKSDIGRAKGQTKNHENRENRSNRQDGPEVERGQEIQLGSALARSQRKKMRPRTG